MGYDFSQGNSIIPSAPVPNINNDQVLTLRYCVFRTSVIALHTSGFILDIVVGGILYKKCRLVYAFPVVEA